ncbi:P-loop containing nucleoside triphosphate hydrolase protein [Astrocystis sublimbata]|nr:P-loop containing nucleoside triphosphate hydrolase protein [Astrocystis sublimbata]
MIRQTAFQAAPMAIKLAVAIVYLFIKFGRYEGFVVIGTTVSFLLYSIQSEVRFKAKSDVSDAFQYLILYSGLLLSLSIVVQHGLYSRDVLLLMSFWVQLSNHLHFFARLGRDIGQQIARLQPLSDVLRMKPSVVDNTNAQELKYVAGKVELNNVVFSYDRGCNVLDGFSLSIPSGSTLAFVGTSGAGKSTILNILMRQFDVQNGSILIDGQDVRHVTLHSLLDVIGIVPQSPQFFVKTILENVRYARPTASDKEVHDACKAAAIHDQIMGFPMGYQTQISGDNGNLSGGQKQRIALARAILKNPRIFLLDEATSAIDARTERQIQESLAMLCRG